jgi:hypothetical protein
MSCSIQINRPQQPVLECSIVEDIRREIREVQDAREECEPEGYG